MIGRGERARPSLRRDDEASSLAFRPDRKRQKP